MSDKKNLFEALASLGGNDSETPSFETLFQDITDDGDENPFAPKSAEEASYEPDGDTEDVSSPIVTSYKNGDEMKDATLPKDEVAADSSDEDIGEDAEDEEEPANPLMAAIEKREHGSIFAKPPIFKHGSAEEPIENLEQTFDELRVEKSGDFPELEDANRVTWTVTYGKSVKNISGVDAKKKKIGAFKKEIEASKDFLSALKKSKDKNPDCIIKPTVKAQSKGERMSAYKGVFNDMESADNSGKLICIVPGSDGKVYEIRNEEMGRFITPAGTIKELSDIEAGFTPALPLIPKEQLIQIVSFFRSFLRDEGSYEAIANIFWDRHEEVFLTVVPKQSVGHARANSDLPANIDTERYLHYMDIHSHNVMNAKFSIIDDMDERATRLYAVVGRLDNYFPRIKVRLSNGGKFKEIDPALVFEALLLDYPEEWGAQVTLTGSDSEMGCAA